MQNHRALIFVWTSMCLGLVFGLNRIGLATAAGQEAPPTDVAAGQTDIATVTAVLSRLGSPDFRTRQAAREQLKNSPQMTLEAIEKDLATTGIDVASQEIELLDYFANLPDLQISTKAFDLLQSLADRKITGVSSLAGKCIEAIQEAKEKQAIEVLSFAEARIGLLGISLNGSTSPDDGFAVEIDANTYKGDRQSFHWLQYLRSIEIVSIEGPLQVDAGLVAVITKMPQLRKIRLRNVQLEDGCLSVLKRVDALTHLELMYVNIGDEAIPTLCELPISQSLRLFGTQITADGQKLLRSRLDGLEIFIGKGGFLGITSNDVGEVRVERVVADGAAEKAGIMSGDVIFQIDEKPIKNFPELRSVLANYNAGRDILVKVRRGGVELDLTVTLGQQP